MIESADLRSWSCRMPVCRAGWALGFEGSGRRRRRCCTLEDMAGSMFDLIQGDHAVRLKDQSVGLDWSMTLQFIL